MARLKLKNGGPPYDEAQSYPCSDRTHKFCACFVWQVAPQSVEVDCASVRDIVAILIDNGLVNEVIFSRPTTSVRSVT